MKHSLKKKICAMALMLCLLACCGWMFDTTTRGGNATFSGLLTAASFSVSGSSSLAGVSSGALTATAGVPLTVLSGSSNNMQENLGRSATEANIAVPQSNGFYFTNSDLAAGDLVIRELSSTNRIYLGAGAGIAPFAVSNVGANFYGSTSGLTAVKASATASGTLTLPAVTDTLVGKATTDTLTNKTLGGTIPYNRLRANQGSTLVVGDVGSLSNFGTTASVAAVSGTDSAGTISILSNGTGQVANGGFNLTFHDGTWTTSPVCVANRAEGNGPNAAPVGTAASATTLSFIFSGTAVAGVTYTVNFICMGK